MLDQFVDQVGFRFRADDGSEVGASWLELENVPLEASITAVSIFRLRLVMGETNGETTARNTTYEIHANLNGSAFSEITTIDTGIGFVITPSAFVTANTPTTGQLVSGGGAFEAGVFVTAATTASTTIGAGNHTEWEWCLAIDPGLYNDGDIFQFRVTEAGVPIQGYSVSAQFNLGKPNFVTFSGRAIGAAGAASGNQRSRGLVGGSVGVALASSNLTWVGVLKAAVAAVASATGILGGTRRFTGSAVAVALASGPLAKLKDLAGSTVAVAIATASFVTAFYMGTASGIGIALAAASFNRTRGLQTAVQGVAIASGGFTAIRKYFGTATGVAVATATLSRTKVKSGDTLSTYFGD